ncbi:MAG: polar amino acid transport system substrate-binding protein [Francisellaceae bacterium]|jgi:polar amino acid transport system substrate-binding protein
MLKDKKNSMKTIVLFILTLIVVSPSYATEKLRIIGEDSFPPFNYYLTEEKKEIRGFTIELIQWVLEDSGIQKKGDIGLLPWARALKTINSNPNVLILDMARKPSREKLYKWVGPIAPREIWLYKLKSRKDLRVNSIQEIQNYMVGVMRGSSSSEELIQYGFEEGKNLAFVSLEAQNIKKVLKGRVDFITFNQVELERRAKSITPSVDINMFEPVYLLSGELQYYFALSKQTSNETVIKLQKALDQIKHDGRYRTLWKKYME